MSSSLNSYSSQLIAFLSFLQFLSLSSLPKIIDGFAVLLPNTAPQCTTHHKDHHFHVVAGPCDVVSRGGGVTTATRVCSCRHSGRTNTQRRVISLPLQAAATTTTTTSNQSNENNEKDILSSSSSSSSSSSQQFKTKPMQVYIEDTDAFGVVYNGNYIKFYERALQSQCITTTHTHDHNENVSNRGNSKAIQQKMPLTTKTMTKMITHVTNHKFKSAARLGDEFIIHGEMIQEYSLEEEEHSIYYDEQVWDLKMVKHNPSSADNEFVFNTATITLSNKHILQRDSSEQSSLSPSSSTTILAEGHAEEKECRKKASKDTPKIVTSSFQTYHDEFAPMIVTNDNFNNNSNNKNNNNNEDVATTMETIYHLPFHSILKYFERVRSNTLGGPEILDKMQVDNGIIWVITSIDDMSISKDFLKYQALLLCSQQQDVKVETKSWLKRGGMIVSCDQELCIDVHGVSTCLSKATTTICAVDVKNGYRPTKDIPDFVRELFK